MTELVIGHVVEEEQGGTVLIRAPLPSNIASWEKQNPSEVLIKYHDSRKASPEQIKKIHAMIGDISEWIGDSPDYIKQLLKQKFILDDLDEMETEMFSFADCSMEKARLFITFLVNLMIKYQVPCKVPLYEQAEDIQAYIYACIMNKVCCVCGQHGVDLHHVVPLGMGANRETKPQLGYPILPLCREHHTIMHTDSKRFMETHHLVPIKLTDEIAKLYGFGKEARQQAKEFL